MSNNDNKIIFESYSADIYTPVAVYNHFKSLSPYSVLYESVEKARGKSRYSIIATDPDLIWSVKDNKAKIDHYSSDGNIIKTDLSDDISGSLRDLQKVSRVDIPAPLPSSASGLFGYFSYDMVRFFEKLPDANPDPIGIEDSILFRPRVILIFDNLYDILYSIRTFYNDENNHKDHFEKIRNELSYSIKPPEILKKSNNNSLKINYHITQNEYEDYVRKSIEYIYAGDAFQIVPSQRFHLDFSADSFDLYRSLRRLNPSPYMFHANFDNFTLVGASPEILVRVKDKKVTIRPIAGTRPRGKTEEEDLELEKDLLNDPKECAEHLMLLDLSRNDVGRVSEIGTVKVTEDFIIERYSHVMHIVSNVEGELKKEYDFLDAVFSALPVGTVSGAPKIRAMEIINELEQEKRGFYAGGIGYFSADGSGDMALMLRTALVKDKKLYIQAGAGVVADSIPEKEYQETINKAGALVKAAGDIL